MEIAVKVYDSSNKKQWDDFVKESKNGTFLFYRDYMDYHSDRFNDYSLLFFFDSKLVALLPANLKNDKILFSHEGLTYGGLILSTYLRANLTLVLFDALCKFLHSRGIEKIVYKKIPYIYYTYPADEDLYALFRLDAKLISRSISSCIFQKKKISYSKLRKRCINKSYAQELIMGEETNFDQFWSVLQSNLGSKYNATPTHTLEEIELLHRRFPQFIKLYTIRERDNLLGGCLAYNCLQVCHVQYIASTLAGRKIGALDKLFNYLINHVYKDFEVFEFGTSTEMGGRYLNADLISQKEGFGARAIMYDTYELTTKHNY